MSEYDAAPSEFASDQPSAEEKFRWSAGIVNHGTYDDLERCFVALAQQSVLPEAIVVYDTGQDLPKLDRLRLAYPTIVFRTGHNRGYAGGANLVVGCLENIAENVDFILLLNPDVELEPDYARNLVEEMIRQPDIAIASGKLLRPDRMTLDSAGIVMPRNRRPHDRGSNLEDHGQFNAPEYVDAASGAAMMLRRDALDDLRIDGELFDEIFFAYHEDTDLCWRARLFGWRILYEPRAIALHRRGWQRGMRFDIPIATRRHSFKNHYLQILKNEKTGDFLRNLPWLFIWEVLRLGFALGRDWPMLLAYHHAWEALPETRRKRGLIQAKARSVSIRVDPQK